MPKCCINLYDICHTLELGPKLPNDDVNCRSAANKTKEASHRTSTRMISKLWS